MKLKWTMPMALVVFFVAGCGGVQNTKPVSGKPKVTAKKQTEKTTHQTIKIHDESILKNSPIINIIYPQIEGMKDKVAQAKINDALKKYANHADESQMTNDDHSMPPSFSSKYKITFQNDHLISFVYDQYLYLSGAAHGMPSRVPILVDLDDGKIVEPNELFNGSDKTKQIISQLVLKGDVFRTFQTMGEFNLISSDDLKNVYLTKDGLIIYFPPYEYASFAEGTLQYQLSFSDIQSIINSAFFKSHGIDLSQPTNSTTIYASEGYHFSIPKKWIDHLIFERGDYSLNNNWLDEINVYYNSTDKPLLFSIHMYDKQKWAGTEVKLAENDNIIYSYSVAQSSQNDSQVTDFKKNVVPEMMKTFQLDF